MQDTNLNVTPYFDDYQREKQFYKVLFKPGYPVQSRELTTLQSILQNQVERFGQHIFKDGSMVIPGQIAFDVNYQAVTIQPLVNGTEVETYRTTLVGQRLTGSVSGVTGLILYSISEEESDKKLITLYVKYISGGNFDINGNQYVKFTNNENLIDSNLSVVATTSLTDATSYVGSIAHIESGVYFSRGYFVEVNAQSIILDQYANAPSYKVGLKLQETIVSASDDESLKDNSLGYSNFSAPGADRLKINAELVKIGLDEEQDKNFIELLRLRQGVVEYKIDRSTYAELGKNIARRTYEESGNYSVVPFKLTKKETLNNLFNNGTYELNSSSKFSGKTIVNGAPTTSEEINGNDYFTVEICPGKAYVKGYEVETVATNFIDIEKSRTTLSKNNEGSVVSHGNYFELENSSVKGTITGGAFTEVYFYDKVIGSPTNSNLIGKAKCYGLLTDTKTRLYVLDFNTFTFITYNNNNNTLDFAVQTNDFVFGSLSGASGIVSVNPGNNTVQLQQVSGNFILGETLTNSRNSTSVVLTALNDYKTDRIRSVSTQPLTDPNPQFSANISLDSIPLSGSSFVVSGGTSLSGVNTSFLTELYVNTTLQFGSTTTTISAISTNSGATLSSSVNNQSYTTVSKLVATLRTSGSEYFSLTQNRYVSSLTDVSFSVLKDYIVTFNNGTGTLVTATGEVASGNVLIQTATTSMTGSIGASNIITCSNPTFSGNATVYAKVLISNPTVKQKTFNPCTVLKVNKTKGTLNTVYGTRRDDYEISLAKPDVVKIHAVHQATSSTYTEIDLFDSIIVTNATNFNVGDTIYSSQSSAKAKIVSKSGNTLSIIYFNNISFSSSAGNNIVKDFTTDAETTVTSVGFGTYIDITNSFELDKNISDEIYDISKLVRKNGYAAPQYDFVVVYDYYSHGSGDYFNATSYPLNQVSYETFGSYNDYNLTDIIDFRLSASTANINTSGSGTLSSPLVLNSATLSKLTRPLVSKNLEYPGTTVTYDYSHYVGRIDTLVFDENGKFKLIKGNPSLTPSYPQVLNDNLPIASFVMPPYVMDVNDIYVQNYENKRYTMSDIGLLDKRLSNVEYYTSLNLLEVDTNTLTITDDNGFNRFKNGFVVDSFQDFTVSDLTNVDYKASVDVINTEVRPSHYTNNVDLEFIPLSSTNYKKTGSLITLNYTDEVYVDQPFASKAENVNPFNVFSWVGRIDLTPSADNWVSTTRQADNIIRVEGNFEKTARELGANSQGVTPTQWGAWRTLSSSTTSSPGHGRRQVTTTTTQQRTGTYTVLTEQFSDTSLGDTVLSTTTSLYMRERTIGITATRMKPNYRLYLFLNNTNMTNYTIATLIEIYKGGENGTNAREFLVGEQVKFANTNITATVISPANSGFTNNPYDQGTLPSTYTGTYGYVALSIPSIIDTPIPVSSFSENATITGVTSGAVGKFKVKRIICDNSGQWFGNIIIPDPNLNANPRFANGQTTFRLTTSSTDSRVPGTIDTDAEVTFSSSGSTQVVQKNVVSVRNAVPERRTTTETQTTTSITWVDPLAQSFLIDRPGGVFLTKVDLYFQAKDTSIPVNVQIRTMENGSPTQTVVPFSDVSVLPSNVNISDTATSATTFTFPSPVYLSQGQEYALVVWTNCDNYKAWIARLGETDVTTNRLISENPYAGVLFKSQNASTWTPDQYEDLKFKMYYAKFNNSTSSELFFENKTIAENALRKDPITMTSGSSVINITQPNHCMHTTTNKVTISGVKSEIASTTLSGSTLTNTQNTGTITITLTNAGNLHTKIGNTDISVTNPGYIKIGDEIISYSAINGNTVTIPPNGRGINSTTIISHSSGEIVECYNLNGIPLTEINKTHNAVIPVTLDAFNLQLNFSANNNLTSGGDSAFATRNIQYEHVTANIATMAVTGTDISAKLNSITGTSISSNTTLQPSYQGVTNEPISLERINDLGTPRLVASAPNQSAFNNNNKSIKLNLQLSSDSDNLSPVIDLDRCSLITTSNRINKLTNTSGSLSPSNTKNESNYVTKVFTLENSSTALKVLFEGVRFNTNNIRVYVKIGRDDALSFNNTSYIELTPSSYPSSSNYIEYKEFEFEAKGLAPFKSYSVKIEMDSDNQALVPVIRKFRAIALAV